MIKSTVWSAGTSSVFSTSRGLALAAVLSGSALGQMLAPLIANTLIQSQGWAAAYFWIGVGWAGLAAVLVALFFHDAHALGNRAAAAASPGGGRLPGLTIPEAIRDSRIIRIAASNLLMAFVGSGVTVHMVPMIAEDRRHARTSRGKSPLSPGSPGSPASSSPVGCSIASRAAWFPFSSYAIGSVGYVLLTGIVPGPPALMFGAVCVGYGGGAGLQVSTYLISRYAGLRNFGAIFGTIASAIMLGTSFGPLFAARIHDVTGSYAALLWTAAPLMMVSALLFVGLGPYPIFDRPEEDPVMGLPVPAE